MEDRKRILFLDTRDCGNGKYALDVNVPDWTSVLDDVRVNGESVIPPANENTVGLESVNIDIKPNDPPRMRMVYLVIKKKGGKGEWRL